LGEDFLGLRQHFDKDTVKLLKNIRNNIDRSIAVRFLLTIGIRAFQRGETVGIFQYESPGMQKNT
jgi:DNA polymerase-3 subunit alpha